MGGTLNQPQQLPPQMGVPGGQPNQAMSLFAQLPPEMQKALVQFLLMQTMGQPGGGGPPTMPAGATGGGLPPGQPSGYPAGLPAGYAQPYQLQF